MKKIYNLVYSQCNQLKNGITYTIDIIINFMRKIKNFFYWGWKLRNDYDYDYSSIYYILNLKLNKMHKKMTKDDWGRPAKAREMVDLKVCAHLAKELSQDLPRTEKEYNELPFDRENWIIDKDFWVNSSAKKRGRILDIVEKRKKSQTDYFWKTLQKQIERWWT